MNKNFLIIVGIVLAGVAGYFIRGAVSPPRFQTVTQLCFYKCEVAHTQKMNEIYANYDRCMAEAQSAYKSSIDLCSNLPTIQLINQCFISKGLAHGEANAACLKTRNDALAAETESYSKCKEICQPNWKVELEKVN
jgi:hypothetical protein